MWRTEIEIDGDFVKPILSAGEIAINTIIACYCLHI